MAKVTEQDLLDRWFKRKYTNDKSAYWFEKKIKHKILKDIILYTDHRRKINLCVNGSWYPEFLNKPLTHANLELFIRFAEGKGLAPTNDKTRGKQ